MELVCVTCGEPIAAGNYRLVGVERGTWASQYAHRGPCEAAARKRFAPRNPINVEARPTAPVVEELTIEPGAAPGDVPSDDLPWIGMERRR